MPNLRIIKPGEVKPMVLEEMNHSPIHVAIAALMDIGDLLLDSRDHQNAQECINIVNETLLNPILEQTSKEVAEVLDGPDSFPTNIYNFPRETGVAVATPRMV